MERCELDLVLKNQAFIPGGTREACVKIRDFMINFYKYKYEREHGKNTMLKFPESCVNLDEFIEAVNVLVSSSFLKKDEVPARWHCVPKLCKYADSPFCYGMFNLITETESERVCPFWHETIEE